MAARGKARVPSESELKRLFASAKDGSHGLRNDALLTASYRLGLRAKEIAPRVAYLSNPAVRWALKAYLDKRRNVEGLQFDSRSPLFVSQKGGGFTPNTIQQLFHRLHQRAGIIGGRSHSGRRWFATELISKGIDIKAVSVLMGHSSVAMTAQYAEDNPQRLRKIAANLGS